MHKEVGDRIHFISLSNVQVFNTLIETYIITIEGRSKVHVGNKCCDIHSINYHNYQFFFCFIKAYKFICIDTTKTNLFARFRNLFKLEKTCENG